MTEQELIEEAQKLIRRYDNMRIVGSRGEWSGNVRQGFMFNPQRGGGSSGGGGGPPLTGACCLLDGTCEVVTLGQCLLDGGVYQGDGTSCTPNPCTHPTGACCIGSDCSIQTESDCTGAGGTYQGDGTTCDPNPCPLGPCPCNPDSLFFPFFNPDDGNYYAQQNNDCCALSTTYALPCSSTTRFSTLTSVNESCSPDYTGGCTITIILDPDTCEFNGSCSGGPIVFHDPPRPDECIESCGYPGDGCDGGCSGGGCAPGTTNVVTLSGGCDSGL